VSVRTKNRLLALGVGWLAGWLVWLVTPGSGPLVWCAPPVAFLVAVGLVIWPLIKEPL
jgi:hypothetical protein